MSEHDPQSSVETGPTAREPRNTYRLQITAQFPLQEATRWVDYLHRLGADWVYTSPLLTAEPGSDHGYDVIDHATTDASRGGRAGLRTLADECHRRRMGVLVDIVPNHVGVASPLLSVWWRSVLHHGSASPHAAAFDIDWQSGGGKVLLPILGDGPDEAKAITCDETAVHYYEHSFPLAPGSYRPGDAAAAVLDRQHYRLVSFRRADTDLNYRRFFAVNSLAAIRVEDPTIFAASHSEIRSWIEQGWVDGLRVDHPDGLADPQDYLDMLADLSGDRYTLVEKILEPGEQLDPQWRCDGTTGYDALALIERVLISPDGVDALTALDTELRGSQARWPDLVHGTKRAVADGILGSEVRRLMRDARGSGLVDTFDDAELIDAIAELVANFDVYRSYRPATDTALTTALDTAQRRRPDLAGALRALAPAAADPTTSFATRLQQTTGAVMAKGVEDCAFYRYPRLVSLTEVGGDPSQGSISSAEFHAAQQQRLTSAPHSMTTLSTHDTKRGEDVRARIDVLCEVPSEWAALVRRALAHTHFPDRVFANLLLQTALGAWPLTADRLQAYALKAAREAGNSTQWIDPDPAFEDSLRQLVDACTTGPVADDLAEMARQVRPAGWSNSLAAKLLALTSVGVPDVYRGTELWSSDLVDPDNRRPFDALQPGGAAELLARIDGGYRPAVDESGAAKLLVTSRALRLRRDRANLFTDYRPITATGPASSHVLAYDRGGAITAVTRLPLTLARSGGWRDTVIPSQSARLVDAFTGAEYRSGSPIALAELFDHYPVALLTPVG